MDSDATDKGVVVDLVLDFNSLCLPKNKGRVRSNAACAPRQVNLTTYFSRSIFLEIELTSVVNR